MTHEAHQTIEPVNTKERIDILDILRGFAIFWYPGGEHCRYGRPRLAARVYTTCWYSLV